MAEVNEILQSRVTEGQWELECLYISDSLFLMDHIGLRQLTDNIVRETRSETWIFKIILARFSVVKFLHVPITLDLGLVAVDTTFHLNK